MWVIREKVRTLGKHSIQQVTAVINTKTECDGVSCTDGWKRGIYIESLLDKNCCPFGYVGSGTSLGSVVTLMLLYPAGQERRGLGFKNKFYARGVEIGCF